MGTGHRFASMAADCATQNAFNIDDPGASGAIPNYLTGICHLVSAAAESRSLAVPECAGLDLTLVMKTDAGDITLTVASAYDETGGTTVVFSDPGEFIQFRSYEVASGTYAWRVHDYDGVTGPTTTVDSLSIGGTLIAATGAEINRAADMSTRVVNCTASTLAVTEADHDGKTIVLDRAAGIAVTLPAPVAGMKFRFLVKTTFTGAASIKSTAGTQVMIGHALMGNDSDNTTVLWQALAASTYDTIDLFGTANSTGGIAGQVITIEALSATLWYVEIIGDAAGTEATPFADTVA